MPSETKTTDSPDVAAVGLDSITRMCEVREIALLDEHRRLEQRRETLLGEIRAREEAAREVERSLAEVQGRVAEVRTLRFSVTNAQPAAPGPSQPVGGAAQ